MTGFGIEFDVWEPVYTTILAAFGYDRRADQRARDRLADLCEQQTDTVVESLDYSGQTVAIVGGADTLTAELEIPAQADVVVGASVGADRLREAGVSVDCMVTDLDKNPETARTLAQQGTPVAVHAHGDNSSAIEAFVPSCRQSSLIPTTQARPTEHVYNPGGFTDGDRAAFLAHALGAKRLVFAGWSFDDPTVSTTKRRKLDWAARLLVWLEQIRNEQFELLESRRDTIDLSALPTGN